MKCFGRLLIRILRIAIPESASIVDVTLALLKTVSAVLFGGATSLSLVFIVIMAAPGEIPSVIKELGERYDELVTEILSKIYIVDFAQWIVGLVQWIFSRLRPNFLLDVTLLPYWRHVFVLFGFYFVREALVVLAEASAVKKKMKEGDPSIARVTDKMIHWLGLSVWFNFLWGGLVGLVFAVLSGLIPQTLSNSMEDVLLVMCAVLAAEVYQFVGTAWDATVLREYQAIRAGVETPSWTKHFTQYARRGYYRTLAGTLIAVVGVHLPYVQDSRNPGLAVLIGLVMIFAVYWLWDARRDTVFKAVPKPNDAAASAMTDDAPTVQCDAFLEHPHTALGISILQTFILATLIVTSGYVFD